MSSRDQCCACGKSLEPGSYINPSPLFPNTSLCFKCFSDVYVFPEDKEPKIPEEILRESILHKKRGYTPQAESVPRFFTGIERKRWIVGGLPVHMDRWSVPQDVLKYLGIAFDDNEDIEAIADMYDPSMHLLPPYVRLMK